MNTVKQKWSELETQWLQVRDTVIMYRTWVRVYPAFLYSVVLGCNSQLSI